LCSRPTESALIHDQTDQTNQTDQTTSKAEHLQALPGMQRNITDWERAGSIIAGTLVGALAASRREGRGPAAAAAGGLLLRGLTGYCPLSAAVGRNTRASSTKEALSGWRGVHVREAITINRPVDEVYRFWRQLSNLPSFMTHLEHVEELDRTRSRWTARGPAGMTVSWEAHIINEIPNELIGWQSVGESDVATAGSVHFNPTPYGGTEVWTHLQYDPPAGRLGAWIASLFGEEPSQQIREDLRRLKSFLETGEVARSQDQASGRDRFPAHPSTGGHVQPFAEI
jgi:uncharacterized membrane protein